MFYSFTNYSNLLFFQAWDESLYPVAAAAASRCEMKHTNGLSDKTGRGAKCAVCNGTPYNSIGENLFGGPGVDSPFTDAVESWVREEKACYIPGESADTCSRRVFPKMCGHYTQVSITFALIHVRIQVHFCLQVVWAETTKVACAKGHCGQRGVYISCNYGPAGNMRGKAPF